MGKLLTKAVLGLAVATCALPAIQYAQVAALRAGAPNEAAQIAPRCAKFANELFRISGGHAIYEQHAFGRYLNDLMAIQTHQLCNYQLNANAWAGPLLGYEEAAQSYAA